MKSRLSPSLLVFALLFGTTAVDARKAVGGVSSSGNDIVVELRKSADKVDFHVSSKQPLRHLSLRWVQNPHRLRLTIPGAHLASPAGRVAIDKGVLQWAEAQSTGNSVTVDLATISSPKSRISASSDGKSLNWTASATDISSTDQVPRLPASLSGEANTGEGAPKAAPKKPEVAGKPSRKAAPKATNVAVKPVETVKPVENAHAEKVPKVKVVTQEVAAVPKEVKQVTTAPSATKPGDRLVSLSTSGDLRAALTALAKSAGLKAEIDPGVQGSVTKSFQDVPLNKAVSSILGQQAELYEYTISDSTLKITAPGGTGGQTMTPASPGGRIASDYFPVRDKKAADILEAVRKAVPGLTYTVDERLNQILAEGDPSDLERLRKLLQKVSIK